MKNKSWIYGLIAVAIVIAIILIITKSGEGPKMDLNDNLTSSVGDAVGLQEVVDLPEIITLAPSVITERMAKVGGEIKSDGGLAILTSGVVWGTIPNPTIDLYSKTINGSASGAFYSNLFGLNPNTVYYVRAYATNGLGTTYGDNFVFTTLQSPEVN